MVKQYRRTGELQTNTMAVGARFSARSMAAFFFGDLYLVSAYQNIV